MRRSPPLYSGRNNSTAVAETRPSDAVEVVYARPEQQSVVRVPFRDGLTALEAVRASGLLDQFPAIAAEPLVLGSFGREIAPSQALSPGDRVEISRPLVRDPRDLRRELLKHGLVMGPAARDRH